MSEPNHVESPQMIVTEIEHDPSSAPTKEDVRALGRWNLVGLAMDWPVLALLAAIVFGVVVFGSA